MGVRGWESVGLEKNPSDTAASVQGSSVNQTPKMFMKREFGGL